MSRGPENPDNFINWEALQEDKQYQDAYMTVLKDKLFEKKFPHRGQADPTAEEMEIALGLSYATTIEQLDIFCAGHPDFPSVDDLTDKELDQIANIALKNFNQHSVQDLTNKDSKIN